MNEEQIEEIKKVFTDWNPLKTMHKVVDDLDNYNTEAIDFLFHASKSMKVNALENLAVEIIEQAFSINADPKNTSKLGERLYKIIHKY